MSKKIFLFLLFFIYTLFIEISFANNYIETIVEWYKFRIIKYDTKSPDYIFKIWVNPNYSATNLRELMEANNWISAINWVFFCPASYKECGWQNFTKNERYVEWIKIWTEPNTENRVVFAIDKNKKSFLYQTDKINSLDENKIHYWFSNFPLLLQNWESKINDYVKLWLVDNKMTAKIQRNFICNDKTNRYIYTWYVSAIELTKLPEILIKLWCSDALNLDAGGSSAFIYNSRYIIWPGRNIMDWVIIERKWLDTKEIINKWLKIKDLLEKRISKKSYNEKLEFLDSLIIWLNKIRIDIYNKNSKNIYNDWKKIWYEINLKDINKLKNIYLINYLNSLLNEMKKDYSEVERKKIEEERQKIEEKNNHKNRQDLLF